MRLLLLSFLFLGVIAKAQYSSVETYGGGPAAGSQNGAVGVSRFSGPYGVCHDPATDAIYVADGFNHIIRKIQDGQVTTVAGMAGVSADMVGPATAARFSTPTGVYFKNGWLYICDNINNKIKRMDAMGNVVTIAGSGGQGFQDGPALEARFFQPKSIVVDDNDVVFVADYENHRIRKIENGQVTTVAGSGSASDGVGPALSSGLHRPRDICIGTDGTLYFVDLMNHKVKKLTPNGQVELVAGSGSPASVDGQGSAAS